MSVSSTRLGLVVGLLQAVSGFASWRGQRTSSVFSTANSGLGPLRYAALICCPRRVSVFGSLKSVLLALEPGAGQPAQLFVRVDSPLVSRGTKTINPRFRNICTSDTGQLSGFRSAQADILGTQFN